MGWIERKKIIFFYFQPLCSSMKLIALLRKTGAAMMTKLPLWKNTKFSPAKQFNFSNFSVRLKEPYCANVHFRKVPAFRSSINVNNDSFELREKSYLAPMSIFKTFQCSSEGTAQRNNIALLLFFVSSSDAPIFNCVHAFQFIWLPFVQSFSKFVHRRKQLEKISKVLPFSLII